MNKGNFKLQAILPFAIIFFTSNVESLHVFSSHRRINFMASRKEGKSTEDSNPNTDILSDTTAQITNTIKTWKQVYNILEQKILLCPDDSTEEEDESFSTKLRLVAQSELHKVVARPRIMPYNDMISWALDHIDIPTEAC